MANYNFVAKGSSGNDVKTLQQMLNKVGNYGLAEDGVFGDKTLSAVKDYQTNNKLTVDGKVGDQTWGALTKASTASAQTATNNTAAAPAQAPTFNHTDSDAVAQANALLQQQLANKPGDFQFSQQAGWDEIINKILNREDFSYDLNGDALYQQYKDQYTTQGKLAMMDTMGQAAAMTGGYGNSYAQTAGQQAYQGYLQQLNDVVPELYGMALDQYNQEGQDLYNQYGLFSDQYDKESGEYQNMLSQYYNDLNYLTENARYMSETEYERALQEFNIKYSSYWDQTNFDYQAEQDAKDREWNQKMFDYQVGQDKIANSTAQKKSSDSNNKGYDNGNYEKSVVKKAQAFVGADDDGKWGPNSAAAAKKKGYNSLAEVVAAMNAPKPATFSESTYSEASAYLKANGKSAGGLMTNSEWTRHKNKNNSAGGEHEAASYEEYIKAYVYGVMNS